MKDPIINTYIGLLNKHKNDTNCAFVFGAGPSLHNLYTCDKKIINEIKKHVIIFVNSAIIAGKDIFTLNNDTKKYWISNDALCRNWSWYNECVKESNYTKIVRNSWWKYRDELKDFLFFSPRPTAEGVINPDDYGLSYPSSIPSAIDLCIQMNIKKIFILGLDQCLDKKTNYHHFWQLLKNQPRQLRPAQARWEIQKKVFPINNIAYNALQGFAEHKRCKIYNCNPNSEVDAFEKIKLEEIFEK